MDTAALSLPPKILGFWTRCIRTSMQWSQEALAASANLTPRTIQRIEAGESSSITTRRSLARGLGYDKPDIFDDPEFITTVLKLVDGLQGHQAEELQKEFPDHIRVTTTPVKNGAELASLADTSDATLFHCDDEITPEAKRQAALLFDFLRDLVNAWDDVSFSDRLIYTEDIEKILHDFEDLQARVYIASRSTKMIGDHWPDRTPVRITIGYLLVAPKEKEISRMMVPRRLS